MPRPPQPGLPLSVLMAFYGGLGALGLWTGLACTASVQALLMAATVFKFDWAQEALRARQLVDASGAANGAGAGGARGGGGGGSDGEDEHGGGGGGSDAGAP